MVRKRPKTERQRHWGRTSCFELSHAKNDAQDDRKSKENQSLLWRDVYERNDNVRKEKQVLKIAAIGGMDFRCFSSDLVKAVFDDLLDFVQRMYKKS